MSRFSNYLKNKLEEKNLKLEYVSELTDFSFGMIGHYVNARRQPSYKFLNSYFKAFNISTEEQKEVLEMVELDKMPQEMHDLKNRTINIRTIPVYSSVSAGLGRIPDAEPIDFISIPDISGDVVAVKVSGDSMEPTFSEGDIVVIKKDVEINIGEVGVFFLDEYKGFLDNLAEKLNNAVLNGSLSEDNIEMLIYASNGAILNAKVGKESDMTTSEYFVLLNKDLRQTLKAVSLKNNINDVFKSFIDTKEEEQPDEDWGLKI